MEAKFESKIENLPIITREEYAEKLQRLIQLENDHSIKKANSDYKLLEKYNVLEFNLEGDKFQKLVKKGTELRFVCREDIFAVIDRVHEELGHSGIRKMYDRLAQTYANITREIVTAYLALCETCQLKKPAVRKGIVVKPIVSSAMNSRCQADLIDFQSEPDGDYKYILSYQDHLSKFCMIRPLKSKTAEEVALQLVDIFSILGAPVLLHTDNGREFTANRVIEEIHNLWPNCKMVHGSARHSQSQGSIERLNQEIRKMLACWKRDNNTTKWSQGLRFVQWQINSRLHEGIGRSPYKAMFGCDAKLGIEKANLPEDVIELIHNEEQLKMALNEDIEEAEEAQTIDEISAAEEADENNPSSSNVFCVVCGKEAGFHKCRKCQKACHAIAPCSVQEDGAEEEFGTNVLCQHCNKEEKAAEQRNAAKMSQMKQADKMLNSSAKRFPLQQIGATVMVPIPDVDRGRGDFGNVKAVVLEVNEEGQHKLGTEHGILAQRFASNQFTPCKEQFIAAENVPPGKEISLREAARKSSMGTGQGFFKCGCTKTCKKGSCKCFKNNVKCNSKCHSSNPCDNKHED